MPERICHRFLTQYFSNQINKTTLGALHKIKKKKYILNVPYLNVFVSMEVQGVMVLFGPQLNPYWNPHRWTLLKTIWKNGTG